jgi:hypothetical protein
MGREGNLNSIGHIVSPIGVVRARAPNLEKVEVDARGPPLGVIEYGEDHPALLRHTLANLLNGRAEPGDPPIGDGVAPMEV